MDISVLPISPILVEFLQHATRQSKPVDLEVFLWYMVILPG